MFVLCRPATFSPPAFTPTKRCRPSTVSPSAFTPKRTKLYKIGAIKCRACKKSRRKEACCPNAIYELICRSKKLSAEQQETLRGERFATFEDASKARQQLENKLTTKDTSSWTSVTPTPTPTPTSLSFDWDLYKLMDDLVIPDIDDLVLPYEFELYKMIIDEF